MKRYRIVGVIFIIGVLVLGLLKALPEAQESSKTVTLDKEVMKYYQQRELQASPEIKAKLQTLRQEISAKNYTFQVGYTEAMNYPLEKIAGLVEPTDLPEQIKNQNVLAEKAFDKKLLPIFVKCSATASGLDWRKVINCVHVSNQKSCGSCWDFATHGAFDYNYRIKNGCCIDSSEQDTLDCNPWGYSCSGGWWAFQYLIDKGSAKESVYPYTAVKGKCKTVARPYQAATWGYVSGSGGVPSVASLKAALCKYGPLAVAVSVNAAFQAYAGGIFNACSSGGVNHGVTLIGWDDKKGAWLIQNSWGKSWGETGGYGAEKGFMWIKYDCSKIGYAAAWVQATKGSCK
jgi:C1A family cysteine protease